MTSKLELFGVKLKQVALVLMWGLLLWTGFSAWSILSYANCSYSGKADGIIVLGAATWENLPSPVFRERIDHAINLYEMGCASTILFTGGKGDGSELAESKVAKQYAIERGVASGDILIETVSKTTEQNLFYARQLAINYDLVTVIIVSDPLHMKRAMLMAKDMGFRAYSSPTPTTQYRSLITKLKFLMRETYYYQQYLLRRLVYRYHSLRVNANLAS